MNQIKLNQEKLKNGEVSCLITGESGSGKSVLMKQIIGSLSEENSGQIIIIDFESNYGDLRESHNFKIFGSDLIKNLDFLDGVFKLDRLESLLELIQVNYDSNFVIDLSDLERNIGKKVFSEFIELLVGVKNRKKSCYLFIDHLDWICIKNSNLELDLNCKNLVKKLQQLGRHRTISSFFVSQRIKDLPKDISSEFNTILIGKTLQPEDIERNANYIGVSKKYFDTMNKYEFVVYGHGLDLDSPVLIKEYKEIEEFVTIKKEPRNSIHDYKPPISEELRQQILQEFEKLKENLETHPPTLYPFFIPTNPLKIEWSNPMWNKLYCEYGIFSEWTDCSNGHKK